jgi:hypothetical protein
MDQAFATICDGMVFMKKKEWEAREEGQVCAMTLLRTCPLGTRVFSSVKSMEKETIPV